MAVEFGTAKTVLILAIVVGCFAVLWPKLFYPMLQASVTPRPSGESQACCDVIFENDVNAIKVMTELCGNILLQYDDFDPKLIKTFSQGKLTKDVVNTCRNEVVNKCGIDITSFLNERVRLGKSYKQILDEIRSFNSSICLKLNFGINLGSLGAPRRMRLGALSTPKHYRQERPPHLRPDMLHPALRERGRAIPQSHIVPRTIEKEPRPPIPGMRPPMGGPGHVVPAPKGSSTMGIIMPIYTIGIVIFFMYTIMKVMFKKPGDTTSTYTEFAPDPEFHKIVFDSYGERSSYGEEVRLRSNVESGSAWKTKEDNTKLVVTAISGLIAEVDHQREKLAQQAEEQNSSESERKEEDKIAETIDLDSSHKEFNEISILEADDTGKESKEKEDVTIMSANIEHQVDTEKEILQKLLRQADAEAEADRHERSSSHAEEESKEEDDVTATSANIEHQVDTEKEILQKLLRQADAEAEADSHERPSSRAEEDGGTKVKVMGMETTASCECGHKWSRPSTPILGIPGHIGHSRSNTPVPPPTPEPQAIYLEGALTSQSQLLVSDAETHELRIDQDDNLEDPPVILSGKMTLSLINLHADIAAENEQLQQHQGEKSVAADELATDEVLETVQTVGVNVNQDSEEDEEEEIDEEEDDVEVREEAEEEEDDVEVREEDEEENEQGGGQNLAEDEEKKSEERKDVPLVNDTQHELDDTPSATNYTTASAAAEATNATGTEETAADFSAMESIGPDDEQQEELEEEEEVWNGNVHSGEDEEEDEDHPIHFPNIPQQH